MVTRAWNAHLNQFESYAFFAPAVILAIVNGVKSEEFNQLCNAFLIVRAIYNIVYVLAFNTILSGVRSASWAVGLLIITRIFTLAINAAV